jgi:hypothetical protein
LRAYRADRFAGPQITQLNGDGTTNTAVTAVPLFYNETFDPKASQSVLTLTSAPVGGLIAGELTGTYQSRAVTDALVFLPMGSNQMSYLDEVNVAFSYWARARALYKKAQAFRQNSSRDPARLAHRTSSTVRQRSTRRAEASRFMGLSARLEKAAMSRPRPRQACV